MALLKDNLWTMVFSDDVDCGSNVEVNDAQSCSAHMTSCFAELERLNQEFKSELRNDFANILNGMSCISISSPSRLPSPSPSPPSRSASLAHGTSFVTEAYSWLLENIANPYPSSTVKASLAQRYNYSLKAVNSWFVNARRRMGWTTLCRDFFKNRRADALDGAHRALIEEDPNRPLPPNIIHAFVGVKVVVEELYSSTLPKSSLVCDLDTVIEDVSNRGNVHKNKRRHEASKSPSVQSHKTQFAQDCYPSPEHSVESSPSSSVPALDESLTDESEKDENVSPPILAGRKRWFSSEVVHTPMSSSSPPRIVKRPRNCSSLANASLQPAISAAEPLSIPIGQCHKTRKRRISDVEDVEDVEFAKRPQGPVAEPRPHPGLDPVTSYSLESDYSIDEWFNTNFGTLFTVPPPVDFSEPDHSTQWEVELFNNYSIPDSQGTLIPHIQVPSPADSTALDDLLQYLENDDFVTPSEIMHAPATAPTSGSVPQDLPLLPDFSHPIDWAALLSDDPITNPIFSQPYDNSVLPEINHSILQLP